MVKLPPLGSIESRGSASPSSSEFLGNGVTFSRSPLALIPARSFLYIVLLSALLWPLPRHQLQPGTWPLFGSTQSKRALAMCVLSIDSSGGRGYRAGLQSSYTANSSKKTLQVLPIRLGILTACAAPLSGAPLSLPPHLLPLQLPGNSNSALPSNPVYPGPTSPSVQ